MFRRKYGFPEPSIAHSPNTVAIPQAESSQFLISSGRCGTFTKLHCAEEDFHLIRPFIDWRKTTAGGPLDEVHPPDMYNFELLGKYSQRAGGIEMAKERAKKKAVRKIEKAVTKAVYKGVAEAVVERAVEHAIDQATEKKAAPKAAKKAKPKKKAASAKTAKKAASDPD